MGKILIVDDDAPFIGALTDKIRALYPLLDVVGCTDPLEALTALKEQDIDLLLVDLEMPMLDGTKILNYAVSLGMDKNRIVILSGRDSDYLHEQFPMGTCLAVLNKYEAKQKAVLDMIFSSMHRKAGARD
ncbi:MAG: response receiver-like protein [uncultured bacterium]|uniref:Response receiver-related domain protein n=1 Tax=Citrifermentans bemidjiense (strain ATCC BAA-1014 / DSM 16622 / JCM 12645 / Bem) TaxID=404380 RepID=B5E8V3_CITBB|nr:response regulator [Citrifermentans bemidjiense]ACH40117.1 response receiver-related domain protein [Citrifermentans bemidjiense Bem]EKD59347.1 MAG: response receiver-like protein [uncultured bacterium]